MLKNVIYLICSFVSKILFLINIFREESKLKDYVTTLYKRSNLTQRKDAAEMISEQ